MAIPKSLVTDVLKRDHHVCQLSLEGCLGAASVADHRSNRGHGGSKALDHASALIAACGLCNGRKTHVHGAELAELKRRGLIVEKGRTHAHTLEKCISTPVIFLDGVTYWLREDGSRDDIPF